MWGRAHCAPGAPSRNHMIQKNAKEAGWEVPSRKTKHWDGSLAQHMLTTSHRIGGSLCGGERTAVGCCLEDSLAILPQS